MAPRIMAQAVLRRDNGEARSVEPPSGKNDSSYSAEIILSISRIKPQQPLPNESRTLFRRFLGQQMADPRECHALAIRKMLVQRRCTGDRNDRVFVSPDQKSWNGDCRISRNFAELFHILFPGFSISSTRRNLLLLRS